MRVSPSPAAQAVIRFRADAPGVWQFHCHMEQHIPLGDHAAAQAPRARDRPLAMAGLGGSYASDPHSTLTCAQRHVYTYDT